MWFSASHWFTGDYASVYCQHEDILSVQSRWKLYFQLLFGCCILCLYRVCPTRWREVSSLWQILLPWILYDFGVGSQSRLPWPAKLLANITKNCRIRFLMCQNGRGLLFCQHRLARTRAISLWSRRWCTQWQLVVRGLHGHANKFQLKLNGSSVE